MLDDKVLFDRLLLNHLSIPVKTQKFSAKQPLDLKKIEVLLDTGLVSDEQQRKILEYLRKLLESNKDSTVQYKKNKLNAYGRVFGKHSCQNMKSKIRNSIVWDNVIDLDIVNCQTVLLYNFSQQLLLENKWIKKYIKNRDYYFTYFSGKFGCTKQEIKDLFIFMMNGMSIDRLESKYGKELLECKEIAGFYEECKAIAQHIIDHRDKNELSRHIVRVKKGKLGSILPFMIQEIENNILSLILSFLIEKNYIDGNTCILMFDGIMIPNNHNETQLLKELNTYLIEKTKYKYLQVISKPMEKYSLKEIQENTNENTIVERVYKPLTVSVGKEKVIHSKYLTDALKIKKLLQYQTLVIKSTTGTGKTTLMNTIRKAFGNDCQFLSIVHKRSLAEQHKKTFNIFSYLEIEKDDPEYRYYINEEQSIVCVNSLLRYSHISSFAEHVVYIDEINSFLDCLTHSPLLDENIDRIFALLMNIVNTCKFLVVSDKLITDNVFTFIRERKEKNRLFINNTYKKYQNINAYEVLDANEFLKLIKNKKHDEYFLYSNDSKQVLSKHYEQHFVEKLCKNCVERRKEKLELCESCQEKVSCMDIITSESVTKYSSDYSFDNKQIYHSPSLTSGIDFNNEEPQDVFIWITGSSISPAEQFQMCTRTRNIRNLYFHFASGLKDEIREYANFKEFKEKHGFNDLTAEELKIIHKMCKNTYYKRRFTELEYYNMYVKQLYDSDKKFHFLNILKEEEFTICALGENQQGVKESEKNKQTQIYDENKHNSLETHLENRSIPMDKPKLKYREGLSKDYETIYTHIYELEHVEDVSRYEHLFKEERNYHDYLNAIKLMRFYSNEDLIDKMKRPEIKNQTINYIYNKLLMIRFLCNKYEINPYHDINRHFVDGKICDRMIEMDDKEFDSIRKTFGKKKSVKKPETLYNVITLLVSCFNNIDDKFFLTQKTQKNGINVITNKKVKFNLYELNMKKLDLYLEFYANRDPYYTMSTRFCEPFKIIFDQYRNIVVERVTKKKEESISISSDSDDEEEEEKVVDIQNYRLTTPTEDFFSVPKNGKSIKTSDFFAKMV